MTVPAALRTAKATIAAGVAVLLLVAAAGWLVLLGPATGTLGTADTALEDGRLANQQLGERLRELEAQREQMPDFRTDAGHLAVLFPPTADQPGFFDLIDAAARRAGIAPRAVTTLSPTAPQPVVEAPDPAAAEEAAEGGEAAAPPPPPDLAVQTVTLTVEATYAQTLVFVAALERMDRSFLVTSLEVSADEEAGAVVTTVTGSTFVAPPVPFPDLGLLEDPAGPTAGDEGTAAAPDRTSR